MSDVQRTFLNKTPNDVLLGFITYYMRGKVAVHKFQIYIYIDSIESNVNIYSRILNNNGRFKSIKGNIDLVETVDEVSTEAEYEKARKNHRKEKDDMEQGKKKEALAEKLSSKIEDMLPLLNSDVNKFSSRAIYIQRVELIKEI